MADSDDKGVFYADEATVIMSRNKDNGTIKIRYSGLAEDHIVLSGRVLEISYNSGRLAVKNRPARKDPPKRDILIDLMLDCDNYDEAADAILELLKP